MAYLFSMPLLSGRRVVLALGVSTLVLLSYLALRQTEEERVAERVESLARAVSVSRAMLAQQRLAQLQAAFKEGVQERVVVQAPDVTGMLSNRGELLAGVGTALVEAQSTQVSVDQMAIRVESPPRRATLRGRVKAVWELEGLREDERNFIAVLVKEEGAWRLSSLTVAQDTNEQPEARS